jgi:hypothetical protein
MRDGRLLAHRDNKFCRPFYEELMGEARTWLPGGHAMMTFSLISFLVGAALAQRFKVMVLIPMIGMVLGFSLAAGVAHALTAWSVALIAASAAICLQTGYFVGIGVYHAVGARKSSPLTSTRHVAR